MKPIAFLLSVLVASALHAQELDDGYTLGRLNGPAISMGVSLDQVNGTNVNALVTDFRFGKTGTFLFDLPVEEASLAKGDNSLSKVSLPGLRLALHPVDGFIADAQLRSGNLWVLSSNSDGATGFDHGVPKILATDLRLHFLSHDGRIALSTLNTPFAFLYGPELGQDQLELLGDWHQTHLDTSAVRGYLVQVGYGVAPAVQIRAALADTAIRSQYLERIHQHYASLGGDWVSQNFRAGGWWSSSDFSSSPGPDGSLLSKSRNWGVHGYAGFLGGDRGLTGNEVAGNWNGFFSPQLGAGQLDVEDTIHYFPGDAHSSLELVGSARYGLMAPLTIGMLYDFYSSNGEKGQWVALEASLSNIPLRTLGPGQVSPVEYELGFLPKGGQGRVTAQWRLPTSHGDVVGTYEELQNDQLAPYSNPWQNWKEGWSRRNGPQTELGIQCIGGLTDAFFAMARASKVDYFESSYSAGIGYSDPDVKDAWVFDLGMGFHTDHFEVLVDLPYYVGTGLEYDAGGSGALAGSIQHFQNSRMGPFQAQFAAFF